MQHPQVVQETVRVYDTHNSTPLHTWAEIYPDGQILKFKEKWVGVKAASGTVYGGIQVFHDGRLEIGFKKSKEKANYPFCVEYQNVFGNWCTEAAKLTLQEATAHAIQWAFSGGSRGLPVRIHHCAGGAITR